MILPATQNSTSVMSPPVDSEFDVKDHAFGDCE
jgi:hypothetical protein